MATIQDLNLELWLRRRERNEIVWQTKEGKRIPIQELSDIHIVNILNHLSKKEEEFEHIGDYNPFFDFE